MISMIPNYVISYSTRPWFLGVLNVKFHPTLALECLGGLGKKFLKNISPDHMTYTSGCHVLA